MSNQGRFGKYGDIKRIERLRQARTPPSFSLKAENKPFRRWPPFGKSKTVPDRLRIRPAEVSDTHYITRLCEMVFAVYGPYSEMIPQWLELTTTLTMVARIGGQPVGFAMIGSVSGQSGIDDIHEILAVAVEPEKQRLGIGHALIAEIERKAFGMKSRGLYLHTAIKNEAAQRLFVKNGYRTSVVKPRFYPAGQDAIFMFKLFSENV